MAYLKEKLQLLEPAFLSGFTLPDWVRLLRENRWDVDPEYIPRALLATVGSAFTSFFKVFEDRINSTLPDEEKWRQPVFVLGLERSGTTHLFNLLARDPEFCYPTRFDCYNPHSLLVLRGLGLHRMLGLVPPTKRFMDNVETGWLSPDEDNIALCVLSSSGVRLLRVFPRTYASADSLENSPGAKRRDFQSALKHFSRKLVFLHGRRLLLKSPDHTAAIPEILEAFPGARFVTILRDPFSQFASLAGLHRSRATNWSALQRPVVVSDEARLEYVSAMFRRYLDTRDQIPPGHLVEIRYRDLVSGQAATLERIYASLGVDMPAHFRETPEPSYQRNRHPELSPELKDHIRDVYRPFVEAGLFDASDLR